jgi:Ca2+-transporting ATPase
LGSSSAQGLSETETAIRIKHYGFNELPEPARRSLFLRFSDQLTHFMTLLLWVAGTLAFISGTPELGWAIWAVIWINAGFSFWQEFQAEQTLAALNKMHPMKKTPFFTQPLTAQLRQTLVEKRTK